MSLGKGDAVRLDHPARREPVAVVAVDPEDGDILAAVYSMETLAAEERFDAVETARSPENDERVLVFRKELARQRAPRAVHERKVERGRRLTRIDRERRRSREHARCERDRRHQAKPCVHERRLLVPFHIEGCARPDYIRAFEARKHILRENRTVFLDNAVILLYEYIGI